MIRPPGINNGAFVVSSESVSYARDLLLFSASAFTDTGSKSFNCALVSTLETYDDLTMCIIHLKRAIIIFWIISNMYLIIIMRKLAVFLSWLCFWGHDQELRRGHGPRNS
jgi:hypothetical protein